MSNADYLKRYLSKVEGKKKKKKVKCPKQSGIIDDDIDINKLATTIDDEDEDDKPVEFVELLKKQKENISFANNWVACDETNEIKIEAPGNDDNTTSTGFSFGAFKIKQEPLSPSRHSDASPEQTEQIRRRYDSDEEDASPPRRNERHDSDASPPRKTKDADVSPPRRSRKYDSDTSPPRRPSDSSPPRRPKKQDADLSPPRKKRRDSDSSPPRRSGKHDFDSSPPRKSRGADDRSRKLSNGASQHGRNRSSSADNKKRKRYDSSSDISPPRKSQQSSKFKTELQSSRHVKPEPISPRPSTSRSKMESRKRHDSDVESSGDERAEVDEGPKVIIRDKLGRKVDENLIKLEEEKKKAFQDKYRMWGRGLKQKEMMEEMTKDFEKEATKPMARYADDVDLNEERKNAMHADDPMYEYMQRKKAKEVSSSGKVRPVYKGPPAPPNRFNIPPGYRWDGVDRSNGFEVKYVLLQNEREAQKKEHYKWSTEDM